MFGRFRLGRFRFLLDLVHIVPVDPVRGTFCYGAGAYILEFPPAQIDLIRSQGQGFGGRTRIGRQFQAGAVHRERRSVPDKGGRGQVLELLGQTQVQGIRAAVGHHSDVPTGEQGIRRLAGADCQTALQVQGLIQQDIRFATVSRRMEAVVHGSQGIGIIPFILIVDPGDRQIWIQQVPLGIISFRTIFHEEICRSMGNGGIRSSSCPFFSRQEQMTGQSRIILCLGLGLI